MAKNFTDEQNIEFYVNELRILKTDLGSEDRFLTHIAKQLVLNDKQRQELILEVTRDTSFGA